MIGKKLANALVKENLIEKSSDNYTSIVGMDNVGEILLTAIPDRVLIFEENYITEIAQYLTLFDDFIALTDETIPGKIEVTSKNENSHNILIHYSFGGAEYSFKFSQDNWSVSDKFLAHMVKLSKKHLDGVFISFYSGNSFYEYAYVPKKIANVIRKVDSSPGRLIEIINKDKLDAYYEMVDSIGRDKMYEIIKLLNNDDEFYISNLLRPFAYTSHIGSGIADAFLSDEQQAVALPECSQCGKPAFYDEKLILCHQCRG